MLRRNNVLLLLFTMFVSVGCGDLLGLRDIEDPDVKGGGAWVPATQAETIFSNLEKVFEERNKEYYLYNFVEADSSAFRFEPSPAAAALYPGLFTAWDLQDEYAYFASLVSSVHADSVLTLEFSEITLNRDMGDSADYELRYRIEAGHRLENTASLFSGRSYFRCVRTGTGTWVIQNWEDINSTGESDWSVLKASF